MVKLRYVPDGEPTGHLGLVGKGIMYDSGGISIKPSDPMHLLMKMDMGGAAAVLGAFTALRDLGTTSAVTGWLMCTDNMPSGSAYKLGDVLTARGGTHGRDQEHRRRGPPRDDGRARAGRRGGRRRDHRHRHADRARASWRWGSRRPGCSATTATWSGGSRRPRGHRRAGVAAAAGEEVPQAARLRGRRHLQPRRPVRRVDDGRAVPRASSSATPRGRTSTSPAPCRSTPTRRGARRARPGSGRGCSPRWRAAYRTGV